MFQIMTYAANLKSYQMLDFEEGIDKQLTSIHFPHWLVLSDVMMWDKSHYQTRKSKGNLHPAYSRLAIHLKNEF